MFLYYDRVEEKECFGWVDFLLFNLWVDFEEWGGGFLFCVGDGSFGENC